MCKYRNGDSELIEINASFTDSFVSIVSRLWNVRSWVQFLAEALYFYLQDFETGTGDYPAFSSFIGCQDSFLRVKVDSM
jgi:hypothetical protein